MTRNLLGVNLVCPISAERDESGARRDNLRDMGHGAANKFCSLLTVTQAVVFTLAEKSHREDRDDVKSHLARPYSSDIIITPGSLLLSRDTVSRPFIAFLLFHPGE